MKNKISETLKQIRQSKKISIKCVVEELKKYNIKISEVTLYGYENGHSQPNADTFVALCDIYGISSFDIFLNKQKEKTNQTFEKYNFLNSIGKQKADDYITDLSEQEKYTAMDIEDK